MHSVFFEVYKYYLLMKFFQIKIDISLFLYYKYVYLEYHNSSVENIEAKIDY